MNVNSALEVIKLLLVIIGKPRRLRICRQWRRSAYHSKASSGTGSELTPLVPSPAFRMPSLY